MNWSSLRLQCRIGAVANRDDQATELPQHVKRQKNNTRLLEINLLRNNLYYKFKGSSSLGASSGTACKEETAEKLALCSASFKSVIYVIPD